MSNKCSGATYTPNLRETKAYCEGRAAAAAGAVVGTNPHPASSEANAAWTRGHTSWEADPAAGPGQDCCADAYGGGFTP